MHIAEAYSLVAGQKLTKTSLFEKFYPIPVDRFITVHSTSKPIKTYDRFNDVVDILRPTLNKEKISIIQVGGPNDVRLNNIIDFCGATSLMQCVYILNRSMLHFGVDSWMNHALCLNNKNTPIVSLYSNNYLSCVKPYWTHNKHVLLEPDRQKFLKPSFAFDGENPKSINSISPLSVAKAILNLLDLKLEFNYNFLYFGEHYNQSIIECVPDQVVDPKSFGTNTMVIRYDLLKNENYLAQQLQICDCIIITSSPLNQNLINSFKPRIKQVVYLVNKDTDPQSVDMIQRSGIKTDMLANMSEEELNEIKLNFSEIGIIFNRSQKSLFEMSELKDKDITKLYYKSNKFLLSGGQIFLSEWAYLNGKPTKSFDNKIQKIEEDSPTFVKEIPHFSILEELDSSQ